jgi:hypothetical protein
MPAQLPRMTPKHAPAGGMLQEMDDEEDDDDTTTAAEAQQTAPASRPGEAPAPEDTRPLKRHRTATAHTSSNEDECESSTTPCRALPALPLCCVRGAPQFSTWFAGRQHRQHRTPTAWQQDSPAWRGSWPCILSGKAAQQLLATAGTLLTIPGDLPDPQTAFALPGPPNPAASTAVAPPAACVPLLASAPWGTYTLVRSTEWGPALLVTVLLAAHQTFTHDRSGVNTLTQTISLVLATGEWQHSRALNPQFLTVSQARSPRVKHHQTVKLPHFDSASGSSSA